MHPHDRRGAAFGRDATPATVEEGHASPERVEASAAGAVAGLIVLVGSCLGHLGNFAFYAVASRQMDGGDFAQLVAIAAVGMIAFVPVNGIAAAAASAISRSEARGAAAKTLATIAWLRRRVLRAQLVAVGVALALTPVATRLLSFSSATTWLLAAAWFISGIAMYALIGPLQGLGRFGYIGVILAGPAGLLRTALLLPLGAAFGLAGAQAALIAATLVGVVILRRGLRPTERRDVVALGRGEGALDGLLLPVITLCAFALLTNVDVVVANARLSDADASVYSAASLLGKIALYGPAALSLVLLPKVSARVAVGLDASRAVAAVLVVVVGSGAAATALFAITPSSALSTLFGPEYASAQHLLVPFGLVMTGAAVINVVATVIIAQRDRRSVIALVVSCAIYVALLMLGRTAGHLLIVSGAIEIGFLVWYELGRERGLVRAIVHHRRQRR